MVKPCYFFNVSTIFAVQLLVKMKEDDPIFLVLLFLNIEDETTTIPHRRALEDDAEIVRRPDRYARKWRKLAQVDNKINRKTNLNNNLENEKNQ